MKRFYLLIIAITVAIASVSCEKEPVPGQGNTPPASENTHPEPGDTPGDTPGTQPETPVTPSENSFILNGEETPFGSVVVSNFGEYLCIAASTSEGVESFEEILEQDEYLYVAISPLLNGQEFDMMTETKLYTVISTISGVELESVAPGLTDEIISGKCRFAYEDGITIMDISMVLTDDSTFDAKLTAEEVITVNENTIAVDGDTRPIRAAFKKEEEGKTTLYLTSAGLVYASELDIAIYYAYITIDDALCNGTTIDVSKITEAGIVDNASEQTISSKTTETTGTVNIKRASDNPAHYTVIAYLNFGGTMLEIQYDGIAVDFNHAPEVIYEVVYGKNSYKINQVTLDKTVGNGLWRVLVESEGEDLTITLPAEEFDGNPKGFSQFSDIPEVQVTYGENVYSKATNAVGTMTVGIEGENIHVEFTNYKDLSVLYEGTFTTIE